MSELSRVEDLLKTGVEEPVLPMSRLEAILRGEKITPQSRVEELLLQYNPSDILIEKRITANGTYFAVNDEADGYFKVVVDTPVVPPSVLDHLVETITENGTYTYTPEHDGFEDAEVTVNVSSGDTASIQVECKNLDNETVTITSFDESETYTEAVSGDPDIIMFNNLTYSGVWYVTNSANQDVVEIDNSVVVGEVVNGTDLMPYIDQIRINDYGSAGTLSNNVFTFNVSETRGDWSSNVIVNNTTAIDLTNIDRINVDVTVTSQVDYGYIYVLFSNTTYTWGGSQWPSLLYNVDAAIKIDSSGRYTIDTSNISGNQYIYLAATTGKVSVTKGDCDNSKNGTIIGSITGLIGYGGVSSGNSLLYLGYGEQTAIDSNWVYGILPIDTINKASNFDDYLEYDATTKYFTCKLDFDALIVFWVYNLHSSDNRPQVILNDSNNSTIETISTNSTSAGAKGGSGIIVRMSAGYRFKFVNPEDKGWGFVRAKFYKVADTTVYDFNEP
jgi:hypothetical protein